MENYRKSFIRNNRVKKISSEPDAVIKRATSGSREVSDPCCTGFETLMLYGTPTSWSGGHLEHILVRTRLLCKGSSITETLGNDCAQTEV